MWKEAEGKCEVEQQESGSGRKNVSESVDERWGWKSPREGERNAHTVESESGGGESSLWPQAVAEFTGSLVTRKKAETPLSTLKKKKKRLFFFFSFFTHSPQKKTEDHCESIFTTGAA